MTVFARAWALQEPQIPTHTCTGCREVLYIYRPVLMLEWLLTHEQPKAWHRFEWDITPFKGSSACVPACKERGGWGTERRDGERGCMFEHWWGGRGWRGRGVSRQSRRLCCALCARKACLSHAATHANWSVGQTRQRQAEMGIILQSDGQRERERLTERDTHRKRRESTI